MAGTFLKHMVDIKFISRKLREHQARKSKEIHIKACFRKIKNKEKMLKETNG
jgi:hypothetical protein